MNQALYAHMNNKRKKKKKKECQSKKKSLTTEIASEAVARKPGLRVKKEAKGVVINSSFMTLERSKVVLYRFCITALKEVQSRGRLMQRQV
jgi:hypothetical protein